MKDVIESLGRVRLQGIALLALAFVAGGLAGVAVERIRAVRAARPAFDVALPPGGFPGRWGEGQLPPFFAQLDLTEQQRTEILVILQETQPEAQEIMGEMFPRLRAVMESAHSRIRELLTAEQAAQLDSLMESRRGRYMRGGRPFGPGPDPRPGSRPRQSPDGSGT